MLLFQRDTPPFLEFFFFSMVFVDLFVLLVSIFTFFFCFLSTLTLGKFIVFYKKRNFFLVVAQTLIAHLDSWVLFKRHFFLLIVHLFVCYWKMIQNTWHSWAWNYKFLLHLITYNFLVNSRNLFTRNYAVFLLFSRRKLEKLFVCY